MGYNIAMAAQTPRGRIKKGKDLEDYVCAQLKAKGLDDRARRSYGSGNSNGIKADIDTNTTILGQALGIECKHVDKLDLNGSLKQAEKLATLGYEPVLVFKRTQDRYGNTRAVIYLDTLLELLQKVKVSGIV